MSGTFKITTLQLYKWRKGNYSDNKPIRWRHSWYKHIREDIRLQGDFTTQTAEWTYSELYRSQSKSAVFSLLMISDKETHCAQVYFCPSRSNLVSSAYVHNSSRAIVRLRGRFTALILPHLLPCLAHTLQVFAAQGSRSRPLWPEATSIVQSFKSKWRISKIC